MNNDSTQEKQLRQFKIHCNDPELRKSLIDHFSKVFITEEGSDIYVKQTMDIDILKLIEDWYKTPEITKLNDNAECTITVSAFNDDKKEFEEKLSISSRSIR